MFVSLMRVIAQHHHPRLNPQLNSHSCVTKPITMINIKTHTGRKRRIGFGKRGKNSFTVHRSEEVLPGELRSGVGGGSCGGGGGGLSRGSSASSDGEGSGGDVDRFAEKFYRKYHFMAS